VPIKDPTSDMAQFARKTIPPVYVHFKLVSRSVNNIWDGRLAILTLLLYLQVEPVVLIKDPTSDMAQFARKGSTPIAPTLISCSSLCTRSGARLGVRVNPRVDPRPTVNPPFFSLRLSLSCQSKIRRLTWPSSPERGQTWSVRCASNVRSRRLSRNRWRMSRYLTTIRIIIKLKLQWLHTSRLHITFITRNQMRSSRSPTWSARCASSVRSKRLSRNRWRMSRYLTAIRIIIKLQLQWLHTSRLHITFITRNQMSSSSSQTCSVRCASSVRSKRLSRNRWRMSRWINYDS